jgi:hypothetical protein
VNYCEPATASGTTYACNIDSPLKGYAKGTCYSFLADVANTGAVTINFNSLGAKSVVSVAGGIATALVANDIRAGQVVNICYDGTNMEMQSTKGNASSGGLTVGTTTVGGGTSTYFLYNNAGVLGNLQFIPGAQGGSLVLLEQHAASNQATVDFTTCISSTYDDYQIELINVVPITNAVNLKILAHTGSGYDSGNNYSWLRWGFQAGGGSTNGADAVAFLQIALGTISSTASDGGMSGSLHWTNPGSSAAEKQLMGLVSERNQSAGAARTMELVGGVYTPATAMDGFRFLMSSGNISTGTFRCYGIAKT